MLRLEQVAAHERRTLPAQVLGAAERASARAAHEPGHLVALLEQQLRQERAVLAGDAGDQGAGELVGTARSLRLLGASRRAPS